MTNEVLNARTVSEIFTIPYTDLTAAGLTQSITLKTLNPKAKVLGVSAHINTPFAGPTTVALEVGDSSTANAYLSSFDVKQAAGTDTNSSGLHKAEDFDGNHTVVAKFTSTGANLNTCTAGEVVIQVTYLHTLLPA